MRRGAATTSRGRRSSGVPVALFPFLAVLMCTMGALALLLVAVNRQSRLQAFTAARSAVATNAATAVKVEEVQEERENVQWRTAQLQASRRQTEAQLAEARLKLGHLEDHAGRLRAQIAQFQASLDELERLGTDGRRQAAEAEVERLKTQLSQAEQQLADARRTAQGRQRSYAIMPYEGPNQTRRRPIYLECCANALILQPEGIVFTADDFMGPLGPGNPLDVALRATREYLLKARMATGEVEEPYPLLLVRPDGIEAYYAARTAMASWGTGFGYELIGPDWKLQFPKPNRQMADVVQDVVASARVRQQQIVAAAPRQYGPRQSTAKYRAAPFRGGVIRESGADEAEPSGYGSRSGSGRMGRQYGFGGASPASSAGGAGGTAAGTAQGSSGTGAGDSAGSARAADNGQPAPRAGMPGGYVIGRPPREEEQSTETENPGSPRVAAAVRPGEWVEKPPTVAKPPEKSDDKQKGSAKNKPKVRSLAESRGRDWGLPDSARGSVGVTRPVRVECHQDHLVVAPDAGTAGSKTIPLGDRTAASVDALISTVWEHMDSWGIAGKGMYWRPVLHVYVAPNGEARFDELKTLLDGSGLDVRRRSEG